MNQDAAAFIQQTSNDSELSPNSVAVARIMAESITGYRPTVTTDWRKLWKASGLARGETLDAINELMTARHLGNRRNGWTVTPGWPINLGPVAVPA